MFVKKEGAMSENRFDFDTVIDRRGTNCGKWDTMDKKYGNKELIHLGVADMDFPSPKPIRDVVQQCAAHGIFGYTDLGDDFYEGFISWEKRMHNVSVKREEIVFCPRINISAGICVGAFTNQGEEVLLHTPAYGPLYEAISKNNRTVVKCGLKFQNGKYVMDLQQMEAQITEKTKMLLLCSPHNPVGRVWTKEELEAVGEFCVQHELLLFVDEIHGDITAPEVEFISALSLSEEVRKRLIVASSPTKTFNIPGFILSYLVIPNKEYRDVVKGEIDRIGMHNPTIFSAAVAGCAYGQCDDWYKAMLSYIDGNDKFTREYFAEKMPEFYIYPREGTYLLWMDYKKLGCEEEELEKWFLEKAKVSVYMGTVFQEEGRGYIRVNIASPRKLLKEAYDRMYTAYCHIKKN